MAERPPLPSPRQPRTKVPSIELIIRTPKGGSVSYIAYLDESPKLMAQAQRVLQTILGIPAEPRTEEGK